jgi:hypothetical protein
MLCLLHRRSLDNYHNRGLILPLLAVFTPILRQEKSLVPKLQAPPLV